jgi:3-oxocholest-4-en-26-oyl-CoA dehydrogenase alpha subunit
MLRFQAVELSVAELALRDEVRAFLAADLPRGTFLPGLGFNAAKDPAFSRRLGEMGWLGMALPAAYGGHDRSAVDRFIVVEELLRWGAPVGHHWVADRQSGPVIAKFGTEAQKQRFLPGICRGELSFCIGMSEPDSGSDLASISSKAVRVDGGWVLDGRKVWTTSAHEHDWIIVLCRTTPKGESPDNRVGLSQLIVDLRGPGVTATPIPFIDGTADFCEVVFDSVFVPDDLVLGSIGEGWAQNTSELAYERGGPDRWLSSYLLIEELLRRDGSHTDGAFVSNDLLDLLGDAVANYWVLHNLSLSVARSIDKGEAPAIESSLVKEMGTRFEQDVVTAVLAYLDQAPNTADTSILGQLVMTSALTQPSFTVRGGTNEVLRSVVSKGLRPSGGTTVAAPPSQADPLVVETAARLLAEICTPEEISRSEPVGWSAATWAALTEAGFTTVGIDEAAGGSGGTLHDLAAILNAVGRYAAPVPLAETAMVGGWALAQAGLPVPDGPIAAVGNALPVLDGRLRLDHTVAWARHAERIVAIIEVQPSTSMPEHERIVHMVEGRDGYGLHVVSLRPDQVTITPGSNMADEARDRVTTDLRFEDVESAPLPSLATSQRDWVGELDARVALSRIIMAAGSLASASQMTIDYANDRRQFGKAIATFQAVQLHLVTVAQAAVRAQMAADVAVRALDRADFPVAIAAAKVVVDAAITVGTRAAHQAHGAMGVTRDYPLHYLTRRLWAWRHEGGTTTYWRRQLGMRAYGAGADALFDLITKGS